MADLVKRVGLSITKLEVKKGADGADVLFLEAIGADETPDSDNEIFDYGTSKPLIEAWSARSAESTKAAGQEINYGNVRAQHGEEGSAQAAAKFCKPLDFDDKDRQIRTHVEVVDADAIKKCLKGIYRGLSIKGSLVGKKWKDGKFYRYTVDPTEFSLVDNPANPNATITVIKADGSSEVLRVAEKKLPKIKAAEYLAAFRQSKTVAKEGGWAGTGMSTISQLGYILDSLFYLRDTTLFEAEIEGDDSTIPARLGKVLTMAAEILEDMTSEEVKELIAMTETAKKSAEQIEVEKAAGKSHFEKAKAAHEELGEHLAGKCKCAGMAKCAEKMAACHEKMSKHFEADGEEAEKAATAAKAAAAEEVVKAAAAKKAADEAAAGDPIAKLTLLVTEGFKKQEDRIEAIEKSAKAGGRPVPVLNGSVVVEKSADGGGKEKDLIEKRNEIKADDPHRVSKIAAIERAAEPELVKI